MNKLISIIAAAAVAAALFTGCTGDAGTVSSQAASDTESVASGETLAGDGTKSPDGYEKTFDGFVQYMTDNEFVSGDGVELTAAAIGANVGKRFTVSSGVSKHTVELYEYTDQTSEAAVKTINNARADGSFHLFESTETMTKNTLAVVTDDGRFLMLYTDASESDGVAEQKQAAADAVKAFK